MSTVDDWADAIAEFEAPADTQPMGLPLPPPPDPPPPEPLQEFEQLRAVPLCYLCALEYAAIYASGGQPICESCRTTYRL